MSIKLGKRRNYFESQIENPIKNSKIPLKKMKDENQEEINFENFNKNLEKLIIIFPEIERNVLNI